MILKFLLRIVFDSGLPLRIILVDLVLLELVVRILGVQELILVGLDGLDKLLVGDLLVDILEVFFRLLVAQLVGLAVQVFLRRKSHLLLLALHQFF